MFCVAHVELILEIHLVTEFDLFLVILGLIVLVIGDILVYSQGEVSNLLVQLEYHYSPLLA